MAVQWDNCNNKQNVDAQFDIKQEILMSKLNDFTPSTAGRCNPHCNHFDYNALSCN